MTVDWAQVEPPAGVPRLASWGRRLAALMVDSVILIVPAGIAIGIAFANGTGPNDGGPLRVIGLVAFFVLLFGAPPVYFTILHGREQGQTIGKRLLGIRVIDARTGGRIGYGRAFVRWLIPFVMNFLCGLLNVLDGLWPLWDAQNQTWHDKAAGSVVVEA
jgi:uncharacterized RDD family membrane protein YckC